MGTVGCSVVLSSYLDPLSAYATDNVCCAIDVCNHFSSLPIENTPVMESNVDEIPAAHLHEKVAKSSISSLVEEAVNQCGQQCF